MGALPEADHPVTGDDSLCPDPVPAPSNDRFPVCLAFTTQSRHFRK